MQNNQERTNPTIAYLRQALRAERRLDGLIERSGRYMDKATRATSRMTATRLSGTGSRSNVEDGAIEMADLSSEMDEAARELAETVLEIQRVILSVPNDKYSDLLVWRYLNGWSWDRITEALGTADVSWTHKMHGQALLEVEKIRKSH